MTRNTQPADERVFFPPDLVKRYGRCRETLWRWRVSGKLPPPDVKIAGHDGWYESTIRAHEQRD
jgi:hypothetical protein